MWHIQQKKLLWNYIERKGEKNAILFMSLCFSSAGNSGYCGFLSVLAQSDYLLQLLSSVLGNGRLIFSSLQISQEMALDMLNVWRYMQVLPEKPRLVLLFVRSVLFHQFNLWLHFTKCVVLRWPYAVDWMLKSRISDGRLTAIKKFKCRTIFFLPLLWQYLHTVWKFPENIGGKLSMDEQWWLQY